MLPRETINLADNLIEAFDSARPAPIEFNVAHQRAAENLAQSGLHRETALILRIRNGFAAYLTEKGNVVLDSLKRAVLATRVQPYADLDKDLKAEIDKHLNPLRQDAVSRLKTLLASVGGQPNALAHPSISFNEIMLKVRAEAELFCAEYVTSFNLATKSGGPVFNNFSGIYGNVTNSQVTLYDYGSINQILIECKIPKPDRRELEDIMDELKNAAPEKKPSLIERAEKLIVKHKEALGAAAELIRKALGL